MIPEGDTEIWESFKLQTKKDNSVENLSLDISKYLEKRNVSLLNAQDGNKLYKILKIFADVDLKVKLNDQFSISDKDDLFVKLQISIDPSKHVNPISIVKKKLEDSKKDLEDELRSYGRKVTTLGKYSYYETDSQKFVKCLVSIPEIKSHPKEKIEVWIT